MSAALNGPYINVERWTVTYEGKVVPFLHVTKDAGGLWLTLDERLAYFFRTEEELLNAVPLVANAMAFGAGYPCFGADRKRNEFNVTLTVLGEVPTPVQH